MYDHLFADVCRAIVHGMGNSLPRSSIWNVCDKNDTDQLKINTLLSRVFKIKCGFYGRFISNVASLRMKEIINTANEKHLKPWNDICMRLVLRIASVSRYYYYIHVYN